MGVSDQIVQIISDKAIDPNYMPIIYVYRQAVKELGLEGQITHKQASKKWENLKKRYKVIICIDMFRVFIL